MGKYGEEMELDIAVSMYSDETGVRIEIEDVEASQTFVEIKLTPKQFCQAMGRLSNVHAKSGKVCGLEKVGKAMEYKKFEFLLGSEEDLWGKSLEPLAIQLSSKVCPRGWISDKYFRSQDSFFHKKGKVYARSTIRRWIDYSKVEE